MLGMRHRARSQHRRLFPAGLHFAGDVSASKRYWEEDLIDPPVEVSPRGTIPVPTSPGLGYHVRHDLIERWTVERKPGVLGDGKHGKRWTGLIFLFCCSFVLSGRSQRLLLFLPGSKPADIRADWKPWIGDYGSLKEPSRCSGANGHLFLSNQTKQWQLNEVSPGFVRASNVK